MMFALMRCGILFTVMQVASKAVFTQRSLSDLTLDRSKFMSDKFRLNTLNRIANFTGVEFRQKISLSDGQVDLQNHLSVMKSTCPTQKIIKLNVYLMLRPNIVLRCCLSSNVYI